MPGAIGSTLGRHKPAIGEIALRRIADRLRPPDGVTLVTADSSELCEAFPRFISASG